MSEHVEQLRNALVAREARVGVIGLGYVGLPLVAAFLAAGHRVLGLDVDGKKIERILRAESYVDAVSDEALRAGLDAGKLHATTDIDEVSTCGAVCICVPTPLGAFREPDLSYVKATVRSIAPNMQPGSLVVLVSTTYPGTTREVVVPLLEAEGHRVGEDLFVAFSPEREDPGNKVFHTADLPRVMGADDEGSRELVMALFDGVVGKLVPVSTTVAAEGAKILENTFRSVNIALVNEMKVIMETLGADIWEVVDAAATKPFGYMPFYPGPGLGGHCIPIDPFYLSWRAKQAGHEARFIELAGDINRQMPTRVVDRLREALEERGRHLAGSHILVLGVAYKKDVEDPRESPSFEILHQLQHARAKLCYHDPHVPELPEMRTWPDLPELRSEPLTDQLLRLVDAAVIVTAHTAVDYEQVVRECPLVIDTRGATRGIANRENVVQA